MLLTPLSARLRRAFPLLVWILLAAASALPARASELELKLPDLHSGIYMGVEGRTLLMIGLAISALGFIFGLAMYTHLRNLPVHESMLEISELIYETCKTYLITQGKFLLVLWIFIAVIISAYFGWLAPVPGKSVTGYKGGYLMDNSPGNVKQSFMRKDEG